MKLETILSAEGREVVLIHYERDGRIICMPQLLLKDMAATPQREAPHIRSGEPLAVTCPLCKKAMK